MTKDHVALWVQAHPLTPVHIDCVITVMLKILDGKCKMPTTEKQIMEWLYDEVKNQPSVLLDTSVHDLIRHGRENLDDAMKNIIYENRLLAETALSRPVMKEFKAMIRQEGLLTNTESDEISD